MAEPDPNPIEPSDDGETGHVDETEVERVLAEAADLSTQLQIEIGQSEPEPGSMADLASFEESSPPSDVDAQLEQVQAMLADVSDATADPPPLEAGVAQATASPEPVDQPMKAPEDWDFDGESEPPESDELSPGEPEPETESDPEPWVDSDPPPSKSPARGLRVKTRTVLTGAQRTASRAVVPVLEHTLRAADVVDGFFAFIRYEVRRILGWVALAILVAAAAIMAYSLKP